MPFRIKLPPAKPPPTPSAEPMEFEQPAKRKRKLPKRYQDADDCDEMAAVPEPERKVPRRRQSTVVEAPAEPEPESEPFGAEIDVVGDGVDQEDQEVPEDEHDHRSEHSAPQSVASAYATTSQPRAGKAKRKDAPPVKKKARKVVVSESEEEQEEEYMDNEAEVAPEPEDDDDDYYSPDEDQPTKGKSKANAAAARKGTKRKARTDPGEASRPALEKKKTSESASAAAAAKKRPKPSLKLDEVLIDVVGDAVSTPEGSAAPALPSPATKDSPAPSTVLKKLKLPTIKKNKLPGSTGLNTPTSASAAKSTKAALELGSNKLAISGVRKAQVANNDLDLSNKSIYEELFKTDGGTSRGGSNRRTKEDERRKELNRLRDEYIAKKAQETVHCFDLQAQYEKIARFEDRLREERSAALYPNFLAAKWRETYEKERKRQKEVEWNEAVYANGAGTVEEGEVK